jgi:lipid A 3-O-deacylase
MGASSSWAVLRDCPQFLWSVAAIVIPALCGAPVTSVSAQSSDFRPLSIFDEFRLGLMAHDIEPHGDEGGVDFNVELLFTRPAVVYHSRLADIVFRPRFHIGTSISASGDTNQFYAGLTWDIPLIEKWLLEVSFGGAVHDGPTGNSGPYSFGCALNFRESLSIGYAVTDRWRFYGTVTHMSNADLCDHNSGLTSAGVRLGYTLN